MSMQRSRMRRRRRSSGRLSRRLDEVLVVGVIEQDRDRFTNEAVAFDDGAVGDRVGKERRVPFG